jgi:hypothetical protein
MRREPMLDAAMCARERGLSTDGESNLMSIAFDAGEVHKGRVAVSIITIQDTGTSAQKKRAPSQIK